MRVFWRVGHTLNSDGSWRSISTYACIYFVLIRTYVWMYACLLASWTQFERCSILEKLLAVICWDYVPETLKVLINYDVGIVTNYYVAFICWDYVPETLKVLINCDIQLITNNYGAFICWDYYYYTQSKLREFSSCAASASNWQTVLSIRCVANVFLMCC